MALDICGLLIGIVGIILNGCSVTLLTAGIFVAGKSFVGIKFSHIQATLDLLACFAFTLSCKEPTFTEKPSMSTQISCGINSGKALFWVFLSFRVGISIMSCGYYFKKFALPSYRMSEHTLLQLVCATFAFATQAILAGIVHGIQSEHLFNTGSCSDNMYFEDSYLKFTGIIKIGVLGHIVSFFAFPIISGTYMYSAIMDGLKDSGAIAHRVAYSEFKISYYLDIAMFSVLLFPHTAGTFLYHFTPGFEFSPHSFGHRLTFFVVLLYPILYPAFAIHLTRSFRNSFGTKLPTKVVEVEKQVKVTGSVIEDNDDGGDDDGGDDEDEK